MTSLDRKNLDFTRAKTSFSYLPVTTILFMVFFVIDVSLNISEIILHNLPKNYLDLWLTVSDPLVLVTAKFVPAVDMTFNIVSHTRYIDRALFIRNVIGLNWLLILIFSVPCAVTLLIEAFKNRELFCGIINYALYETEFIKRNLSSWRKFTRSQWGFLTSEGIFFIVLFWELFDGLAFTGIPFRLYTSDLSILMIFFLFSCLEIFFLATVLAGARIMLCQPNIEDQKIVR